jgi:hypothetical protein
MITNSTRRRGKRQYSKTVRGFEESPMKQNAAELCIYKCVRTYIHLPKNFQIAKFQAIPEREKTV